MIIDWSAFNNLSEFNVECVCGTTYVSHVKYARSGDSVLAHSRKPCPRCGLSVDNIRKTSGSEDMVIRAPSAVLLRTIDLDIRFMNPNSPNPELMKLCPNGDIYIGGRLAGSDAQVVEGMRSFLAGGRKRPDGTVSEVLLDACQELSKRGVTDESLIHGLLVVVSTTAVESSLSRQQFLLQASTVFDVAEEAKSQVESEEEG